LGKLPENPNKIPKHLGKIPENLGKTAPKVCRKTGEEHFFEVTPQKRSAKAARQLFGQVWENLGKNPLHPKNLLAPTPMCQAINNG